MYGKRGRGRPRTKMFDDLMLYVSKEGTYVDMKRRAENREEWRKWMP